MQIVLTDREADIMQVLWDRGPSVVAEVRDSLPDRLAYTTVLTILRNLEGKGYVSHTEEGRVHRYLATVQQHAAQKNAVRHLTDKLFKGSMELLFVHLVSNRKLKPAEMRRLRKLLEDDSTSEET